MKYKIIKLPNDSLYAVCKPETTSEPITPWYEEIFEKYAEKIENQKAINTETDWQIKQLEELNKNLLDEIERLQKENKSAAIENDLQF